jgi:transcriptional regulator with XRE-family HTH domain
MSAIINHLAFVIDREHSPHVRLRTAREIGLLVRTERKRQGLSMQALAERVGCTRQWIAALEGGGERLEVALVLRTLATLGVRLDAQPPQAPQPDTAE